MPIADSDILMRDITGEAAAVMDATCDGTTDGARWPMTTSLRSPLMCRSSSASLLRCVTRVDINDYEHKHECQLLLDVVGVVPSQTDVLAQVVTVSGGCVQLNTLLQELLSQRSVFALKLLHLHAR